MKKLPALAQGLFVAFLLVVSPAHSAQVDGYILKQDGKMVGTQSITVTAKGLRCESIKARTVLLCTAPNWDVLIYNPATKKSKLTPYKDFRGYLQKQMVLFSGNSYFDKPVVVKKKLTFQGFPGTLWGEPPGYPALMAGKYTQNVVKGGEPAVIAYKVLNLPGVTKESESVLERYYSVPETGGVPVDYRWTSVSGEVRNFLTTGLVVKQKVDEALFKPPTGLIPSKNLEDVSLDSRSDGTDELFNMFQRK
jgi:hypothetical protein